MKNQKLLAAGILIIAILAGLALNNALDLTAQERIDRLLDSSGKLQSYHADVTGKIDVDITSDTEIPPELKAMLKMYSNMAVKLSSDVVMKPDDFQMSLIETLDMSGMEMVIEAYVVDDTLLFKYPILGNYILIKAEDLENAFGITLPDNFMTRLYDVLEEHKEDSVRILKDYLNKETLRYADDYIMDDNGYAQTLKVIEVRLTAETLIDLYADMFAAILSNEKGQTLLFEIAELNEGLIAEDLDMEIKTLKKNLADLDNPDSDLRNELEDMFTMLADSSFTYKIGVSSLNIPKMLWLDFNMSMPVDESENTLMHFTYALEYRLSQFNAIDSIEMPQIDENDITTLQALIEKFGGY